jgi:hypothetical protein
MYLQIDGIPKSVKVKTSNVSISALTLSRTDAMELALAIIMSLAGKDYEAIEDSRPINIEDELETV